MFMVLVIYIVTSGLSQEQLILGNKELEGVQRGTSELNNWLYLPYTGEGQALVTVFMAQFGETYF